MADSMHSEMDQLRRQNARLIGLLEAQGIAWRSTAHAPTETAEVEETVLARSPLSTREKVALFRRLCRGRDDVVALRWHGNSSGRPGLSALVSGAGSARSAGDLPLRRGCACVDVLRGSRIGAGGSPLKLDFAGQLRPDQEAAVEAMIHHGNGWSR